MVPYLESRYFQSKLVIHILRILDFNCYISRDNEMGSIEPVAYLLSVSAGVTGH